MTALSQAPETRTGSSSRIASTIDDAQVITLYGNLHPMVRGEFDLGILPGNTRLARMMLQMDTSEAKQGELDNLVQAQHDPGSPLFHKWLTPAQYGARFGASAGDVARVAAWLKTHGFAVDEIPASNRLIIFSGTAEQVAETFHTEVHRFNVNGVNHVANARDPQIPAALAGVVAGVVSLHDFRRKSQISSRMALPPGEPAAGDRGGKLASATSSGARPAYSNGATHYLFPADWATIYDLNPLYSAGKTGAGTSIAIVGRSNINPSDVAAFRSVSGLPANNPTVILVSGNPGLLAGDQDESTLDVEWSGAVAPGAAIRFVVGASSATTDGVDLSAQYIVTMPPRR